MWHDLAVDSKRTDLVRHDVTEAISNSLCSQNTFAIKLSGFLCLQIRMQGKLRVR